MYHCLWLGGVLAGGSVGLSVAVSAECPAATAPLIGIGQTRQQLNQKLIAAVRHQDRLAVVSLLQQGADVNLIDTNVPDANGKPIPKRYVTLTLLMEAIMVGKDLPPTPL